MILIMMMHQGLGLETFNDLPRRKAVHALYEIGRAHV